MNNPVHILCTIRRPELKEAATLVFATLRRGFPHSPVYVYGNGLSPDLSTFVHAQARLKGCNFKNIDYMQHDAWIEFITNAAPGPFWICDTDIVFFGNIEEVLIPEKAHIFGRFEPRFKEEWTKTIHVERIHTCLMYINPFELRNRFRAHMCRIPSPWREYSNFPFIQQTFVPLNNDIYFYDSCAGIYHAIGGSEFSDSTNDKFEHLHCATYSDLVSKHLSCSNLQAIHAQIFKHPELAKGMRERQNNYYKQQAV